MDPAAVWVAIEAAGHEVGAGTLGEEPALRHLDSGCNSHQVVRELDAAVACAGGEGVVVSGGIVADPIQLVLMSQYS